MGVPRKIFREQQDDVWQRLSNELGGEFFNKKGRRQDKLTVKADPWTVTVDFHSERGYKSETLYTRLRAPYVNADGFRFSISHQGVFGFIAKMIGLNDIQIGDEAIDRMFKIKATDKEQVVALLSGSRIRALLAGEPGVHIHVRDADTWFVDEFPEGVDELVIEVEGEVNDLARLESLYVLFATFLHALCHIGAAYEDDPQLDA